MGINIRQKGQGGEREVADMLNPIILRILDEEGIPRPPKPVVQRNQNQSAVGGSDLSNTFGLAIEVKRQEDLSINTWWKQCETAAIENDEFPVLIFRQNGKKWRIITYSQMYLHCGQTSVKVRCEIDKETFLTFFYHWVQRKIRAGEVPRV